MSLALYNIRLYWDGRHGAARCGADIRRLVSAPVLPGPDGVAIAEIDYAPEVDLAQLREPASAWRQMTDIEVARVKVYLSSLTTRLAA